MAPMSWSRSDIACWDNCPESRSEKVRPQVTGMQRFAANLTSAKFLFLVRTEPVRSEEPLT